MVFWYIPLITASLKWNIQNIATMIVKLRIYYPPLLCAGETIELLDIGLCAGETIELLELDYGTRRTTMLSTE